MKGAAENRLDLHALTCTLLIKALKIEFAQNVSCPQEVSCLAALRLKCHGSALYKYKLVPLCSQVSTLKTEPLRVHHAMASPSTIVLVPRRPHADTVYHALGRLGNHAQTRSRSPQAITLHPRSSFCGHAILLDSDIVLKQKFFLAGDAVKEFALSITNDMFLKPKSVFVETVERYMPILKSWT